MSSTLILNADGAPLSWLPLSTISWEEAIKYMVLDKATVLEYHDDWIVRSSYWETKVPSIMMLNNYEKRKNKVNFSKQNVFLRDDYICQYCNTEVVKKNATLDHVLPVSHGGKTTYENSVTACATCNANKGNNKKIVPKTKPCKPTYFQLIEKSKKRQWDLIPHPSWKTYLS